MNWPPGHRRLPVQRLRTARVAVAGRGSPATLVAPPATSAQPAWTLASSPLDWRIAAGLSLLLFCLYLLTFSGVFRSIDELALFSITESLVQSGQVDPLLIAFAPYHNPVGAFEPGYPLLSVPLYALAARWSQMSNIHAVMLLNPGLTAATAGLLYLFGRQLGGDRRAGLRLSLVFGLATMAWPYTKSYLREPAVALLWTLAFLGAALFQEKQSRLAALLALGPALAAVAVKASSVVAWPVLLGLLLWALYRARRLSRAGFVAWLLGAVCLAVGAGVVLLSWRGLGGVGLLDSLLQSPLDSRGQTVLYGLLLSPGKSVFVYSPVLLVALAGWPAFYRRQPPLAVGLVILWLLLLFALRTSAWTGGLTWGPRFLLPLLPLSVLPALYPLSRSRWALAFAALSAAFQTVIATSDWSRTYQYLAGRYPGQDPDLAAGMDWLRMADSPPVVALRLWGRSVLDLAWLHAGLAEDVKLDAGLGLVLCAAALAAAGVLWCVWHDRQSGRALSLGLGVTLLVSVGLLWRSYWTLPDYPGLTASLARDLANRVSSTDRSRALVIQVSPDIFTYQWLGLVKGGLRRAWVSPAQSDNFDRLLPAEPGALFDVVIDRTHIASHYPGDVLVSWLNERAYRLGGEWLDGYELIHYAAGPNGGQPTSVYYAWSTGVALTQYSVPASVRASAALPLELIFERVGGAWQAYDRLFTNLIGPDGQVLAGQESQLLFGKLAAEGWPLDQRARDQRGLWIPAEAAPGTYALVVGFANDQGYVPVQLPSGQAADFVELGVVQVAP